MIAEIIFMNIKGEKMNRLYKGDCLEIMEQLPKNFIDCVICDLPYGLTKETWDTIIPFDLLWKNYERIVKDNGAIVLFAQEPFASQLRISNIKNYKYDIYWEKERLTNIAQVKKRVGKTVENIIIFYKKQCTYNPQMIKYEGPKRTNKVKNGKIGKLADNQEKKVKEYNDTGYRYPTQVWKFQRDCLKSNLHPTQKPLALCENLIKTFSNEGDVILDNCSGSGTTLLAAIKNNRKFIGIEKNSDFFLLSKNRLISEGFTDFTCVEGEE